MGIVVKGGYGLGARLWNLQQSDTLTGLAMIHTVRERILKFAKQACELDIRGSRQSSFADFSFNPTLRTPRSG